MTTTTTDTISILVMGSSGSIDCDTGVCKQFYFFHVA
jgi:hypothetical protein